VSSIDADPGADPSPNEYTVRVTQLDAGWEVHILDGQGELVWSRHCADEAEARTFASTVQQHVYWLSSAKFRDYYRLDPPADEE
jgi:hypothetical protein